MKKSIFFSVLLTVVIFTLNAQESQKQAVVHEITKADLLKMKGVIDLLKMYEPAVDYSKHTYRSFEIKMNIGGAEVSELVVGSDFNDKAFKLFSDAKTGAKIYFEKIRALEPVKREMTVLPSIILSIKE